MKKQTTVLFGIIKGAASSLAISLLIVIIMVSQTNKALPVALLHVDKIKLTDANLVSVIKQNTNTNYLHKIKLSNGKVDIQLHFESPLQLISNIESILDEYMSFYFNRVTNVNTVTIYISEQLTSNIAYKVNMNKADFEVGKEIEFNTLY